MLRTGRFEGLLWSLEKDFHKEIWYTEQADVLMSSGYQCASSTCSKQDKQEKRLIVFLICRSSGLASFAIMQLEICVGAMKYLRHLEGDKCPEKHRLQS